MVPFFDNRADIIWSVLVSRSPCEYWHPPEGQFFTKLKRGAKPGISVCSRIIRLTSNQTKSQKKTTIPTKEEKATIGMLWKVYHNWVASRQTRLRWYLKVGNSPGETRCKKSWDRFEKYGSLKSTLRQASIRAKKGPSLGKRQVKPQHQRSPNAVKFEDRSHEENERQQRCARSKAWNLAKNIYKLKEKDQVTFYSTAEEWVLPAASTKEPEERKFVVDSGACLWSATLPSWTPWETSRSPTTVMTAGEVQTREEATVYVKELDLFVTVMLLEETPALFSLGKLCEDHGYTYHWTSGRKPHLTKKGKRIWLQYIKLCAIRSPWFIYEVLYIIHTCFSIIFITGLCIWR